jgi:murein DD-endopeptidase MepM/ murein hydrolase activator NlpD
MLLRNKERLFSVLCALLSLFVYSCKNTADVVSLPVSLPTLPENGVVTSQMSSFFKKNDNAILELSPDCEIEIVENEYKLKCETVSEFPFSAKKKIKRIEYQTLFPSVAGSFSFFRILIPKKNNVEDAAFILKYLKNEKLQDSKKGNVYSYYEDSQFYFYGVFLPFSPLYEQDSYLLSVEMNFKDGEKAIIHSTGVVEKNTFREQILKFPKGKSKDLQNASRKKYKIQQAARHELWKNVTQPLTTGVWEITKPLDNTSRMTSDFCFTRKWVLNNGKLYSKDVHLGVDYGVPTGTPIYSLLDGVVVSSGLQELYGNMVIVNHGLGLYTNYCHMNKCLKKSDTLIKKGEVLGEVGMTGAATGPHLHIEARIYGIPIDYRKLEYLPQLFVVEP